MISLRQLVEAGVQFGHVVSKRSPRMDEYIWGVRNRVHLIDVSKTALQLEKAGQYLEKVASQGKQILWVGTKKIAQDPVRQAATESGMPYVDHRWVGGTLSNHAQVKKSLTKLLRYEEILANPERYPYYTKKELNVISKTAGRLEKLIGGIRGLKWPVGAIVLVDIGRAASALKEAVGAGVPIVALVDTDCDPSLVDWVIPANDDAPASVNLLINYLGQFVKRGADIAAADRKKASIEKNVDKKDGFVKRPFVKHTAAPVAVEKTVGVVEASSALDSVQAESEVKTEA